MKLTAMAVLAAVIIAGGMLLVTGAFKSSPSPVNPLCTQSAATAFNAAWQERIKTSGNNFQTVIYQAIAATAAREKLCQQGATS